MTHAHHAWTTLLVALAIAPAALGQETEKDAAADETSGDSFRIDEGAASIEFDGSPAGFGAEGDARWSVGAAVGFSDESTESAGYGMLHWFIADDLEFNLTFQGNYHDQDGDDAASGNVAIGWRWHFVNEPGQSWYVDTGIGLLGSTDNVPSDGTSFNFTPRAGVGTTIALFDDSPARLDLGVRWYHVSNASISGSDDNPARDGIQFYAGVMFPF